LRDEVAGVLQGVEAVQVVLKATIEESAAGVREVLVRGLRELGEDFTEFGWVLDEVNQQLTLIAEDMVQVAATTRQVADHQQQTLVEIALLRQEARGAFRRQASQYDLTVSAGPPVEEQRVAALDAAGVSVSAECPYVGLAAFQPQDAGRFFGREQLTAELVARAGEQLARPGLLMVVGPSGSGKSSLLRAGLLPAVAAGALPARGSWAWPRDLMTPGRRPLLELATRVASLAGIPAGALEADLRADPTRITGAIRQALLTNARRLASTPGLGLAADRVVADIDAGGQPDEPDPGWSTATRQVATGARLVLIVDQFEEVFTQCGDEYERRAFIRALSAAVGTTRPRTIADRSPVDAREAPALAVIGIRADFYSRMTGYAELVPHLQDHQVVVGPIGEAGLREAIEKPAALAGLVADAALVEVLLADLGLRTRRETAPMEEPPDGAAVTGGGGYAAGRLALLSYALQQTWNHREGRRLTVAGYRASGGIDGAVAQAADQVYDRLDTAGQQALRRVLLRLVTLGEGTPDTRRRVSVSEITDPEGSPQVTPPRVALAELIDARLVTADADTVEITHETLLPAWPRLRQWLTEDRAGLRIHRDLTGAARDWQQQGRDSGRLFRGTRLAVARDWAADHGQDLNAGERAFLTASQNVQQRTTRRRRIGVAALVALVVLSATVAGVAFQQRSAALTARDQAIASQLTFEASQLIATQPSIAAQLEVAANQASPTADGETRLLDTTTTPLSSKLTGPAAPVDSVALSPDEKILAAGSQDGRVWLWNLADPAHPARLGQLLTGSANAPGAVAFSPDGKILAAGSNESGTVWLWNLADPGRPVSLGQLSTGPRNGVDSLAFSPDGKILAVGGGDDKVWLWNLSDPALPAELGQPLNSHALVIYSVAFSPDGNTLAAGGENGTVSLWTLADPAHPAVLGPGLTGPTGGGPIAISSVAFSPDGKTLAAGSFDEKVWLWNMANPARPARLGQLTDPTGGVDSVAFSPSEVLAVGNDDGTVWLWNLANPASPARLGQPLTSSTNEVYSVAFSRDGKTLAVGTGDDTVDLWNLPANVLTGSWGAVDSVAFSPHGRILAAAARTAKSGCGTWPTRPAPPST
jgi:WD40 repeat protein